MTFEEFESTYPNGFYDAEIVSVSIDYRNREVKLQINLRGNMPDSPDSQEYKLAVLTLHSFYYFSIEPPEPDHLFSFRSPYITAVGYPEDPAQFPLIENLKPTLPLGAFCCRFYIHDWNSFIHVAANKAQLSWVKGEVGEMPATADC